MQNTQGGLMGTIVWLVVMVALFYFMLIRPQKKKEKQIREMLNALKVGDSVVTAGGIVGKVLKVKDDKVCIEIGDRTHKHPMTLKREAIASVVPCAKANKKVKEDIEFDDEAVEAVEAVEPEAVEENKETVEE